MKKVEDENEKRELSLQQILDNVLKIKYPVLAYYHCFYLDKDNVMKVQRICLRYVPDVAKIKEKMVFAVKNNFKNNKN